jgi:hypothetical protein
MTDISGQRGAGVGIRRAVYERRQPREAHGSACGIQSACREPDVRKSVAHHCSFSHVLAKGLETANPLEQMQVKFYDDGICKRCAHRFGVPFEIDIGV